MPYYLIKNGMYYRDKACGYTSSLLEAGLFDKAEAILRSEIPGVTMKHTDDMLAEIDRERAALKARLDLLDKHERHALELRV